MTNTQYQIMLLLFLILVVVYLSGCKLHEGLYPEDREFDYADYRTKQDKYGFIYDTTTSSGTANGDYAKIMYRIKEIEQDILDYMVCNAGPSGTNDDFKNIYQPTTHRTRDGGKCSDFTLTKAQIEAKIGTATTPNTLSYEIAEFNKKLVASGSTVSDSEIAKIFNQTTLPTKYSSWATPSSTRFTTPGADNTTLTVKTASDANDDLELQDLSAKHKLLRSDIVKELSDKSTKIKALRSKLDSDLAELNQLGNSQAMVNKTTMDSTVYASLIWSVLATSLIAYLVTTTM